MTVSHHFEQVVDTHEEALEFGRQARILAYSFNEGFAEDERGS
jgi:hypothetical protein